MSDPVDCGFVHPEARDDICVWCEIADLKAGLKQIERHYGSAEQCREIAHRTLHPECKGVPICKHYITYIRKEKMRNGRVPNCT